MLVTSPVYRTSSCYWPYDSWYTGPLTAFKNNLAPFGPLPSEGRGTTELNFVLLFLLPAINLGPGKIKQVGTYL